MQNTVVIAVVSTKGGVGKTTHAANIGGLAAALGLRVLLIDADVQPSLSNYFALEHQASTGMAEVISRGGLITEADISYTAHKHLHLIRSNITDSTQSWLKEREDRLILLKRAVRQQLIRDHYDLVVIDTQGAKGELQRTAAMAADLMVSPLRPDMMNYTEFFAGTLEMLESLNAMADLSAELRSGPLCMLMNCMDKTSNSIAVAAQVRADFKLHRYPHVRLLDTVVYSSTAYPTARTVNLPAHTQDRPSKARKTPGAYETMHRLLHELLPHLKSLWLDVIPTEPTQFPESTEATPITPAVDGTYSEEAAHAASSALQGAAR